MNPPTSTPLTHCQRFQTNLADLNAQADELTALLQASIETGDVSSLNSVQNVMGPCERFRKEFQERTREMLRKYINTVIKEEVNRRHFMYGIEFESSGRVVFQGDFIFTDNDARYALSRGIPITFIPAMIRKIEGRFSPQLTQITDLDYLEEVDQDIFADGVTTLRSAARLRKVGGGLYIKRTALTHLDALEEAGGIVASWLSSLTSMKSLRKVKEDLYLLGTNITTLESLEEVGQNMFINGGRNNPSDPLMISPFVLAPKLVSVGGGINLRHTSFQDFRQAFPILKKVGKARGDGNSFIVSSIRMKKQIEELKEKGELQYDGSVNPASLEFS